MSSHLVNPLATAAQLARCRAQPAADNDAVLFATLRLVLAAGLLLELPLSVSARAAVLVARSWVHAPFSADEYRYVAAASVFLTSKMGARPRAARDVANVFHFLGGSRGGSSSSSSSSSTSTTDDEYATFHTHVLEHETRLLATLGFDTHVALPHALAITYLQTLGLHHELGTRTVHYLNTALLSPQLLYVTHQPHELAVAALYSAAADLRLLHRLPGAAGAWWEVFDIDRETLGFLVVAFRSVASAAAIAATLDLDRLRSERP